MVQTATGWLLVVALKGRPGGQAGEVAKLEERIHKDNENDWRDVQKVGRHTHTDEEDQGVDQNPQCTHCQPSRCKTTGKQPWQQSRQEKGEGEPAEKAAQVVKGNSARQPFSQASPTLTKV